MARVTNWQLRREMEYEYEGVRPKRQWAIVFDLNKCIACQTCTLACKTTWTSGKGQEYMFWNNVETKPWGSYPIAWDVQILERLGPQLWGRDGRYLGKTIFEAAPPEERVLHWEPGDEDWMYPNLGEDECLGIQEGTGSLELPHDRWFFYLPRVCAHCTYPACLAACPRNAIYKRPEDGIVLIDQTRCKGYGECVRACPYKKSMYNPYTRVSEKCVGCYPAVEQGYQPMCVQNCIGKIRVMGFVSTPERARADNPVDYLVHVKKLALPYYPQLGLEPNLYYIPPIHADRRYLEQMFGPGVDKAIETYRNLVRDRVTAGLLTLIGSTDRVLHRFEVRGDEAIGYGEDGAEVVRVPVTEPLAVRQSWNEKLEAVRTNTP